MRTNQKLKTNVITEWTIVDNFGGYTETTFSRKSARTLKNAYNEVKKNGYPFRIAKTTITK